MRGYPESSRFILPGWIPGSRHQVGYSRLGIIDADFG
jgi:hypothetical protein